MTTHGMIELVSEMRGLPVRVRRRVVRPGLSSAADVVARAIIARSPVKTGLLRRSVRKKFKRPSRNIEAIMIGISPRAYYWKFIELGTERQAAKPFVRPAFDGASQDALTALVRTARMGLSGGRHAV
jgi:HK97 gp10 family phage protein